MIWHRGAIVPDDSIAISVLDRTFEHGLGLFESLRTYRGVPTLLGRHLERLSNSAGALGLRIEPGALPDADAVRALLIENRIHDDARLRITLSGGRGDSELARDAGAIWMTATSLSQTQPDEGVVVEGTMTVPDDDPLARHKTLNYWRKALGYSSARVKHAHDVICVTPSASICETSRYNLFLVSSGRLFTPGGDLPMLPGVMRGVVLERALELRIPVEQGHLPLTFVNEATEAFLTNSVRGIVPISRLLGRELRAQGALTERLSGAVARWIASGRDD